MNRKKQADQDMFFFYQANRLTNLLRGSHSTTCFHAIGHLLAAREKNSIILLATDNLQTMLAMRCPAQRKALSYSAYGFTENARVTLLGFTGERLDSPVGGYLLGNGKRVYSPVLMRFNSPDKLSPFLEGGLNTYAYVSGDPINHFDPTGLVKTKVFFGAGQRLAKDAMLFRSKDKQGLKTLSLDAHSDGIHIYIDDQPYTPEHLINYLRSKKVEPSKFDKICLYACHTADKMTGLTPYAKQFASLSQVPTTGHLGRVRTMILESPPSNLPTELIRIEHRVFLEDPDIATGTTAPFSYSPQTFDPPTTQAAIRQRQSVET
jgi:RHS repeat-associated protein